MKYSIFEGNMERLEKKMIRIQNKCRKYGCDFVFKTVGEEYRDVEDEHGNMVTTRFIIIEAEGVAKVNGWRFIAQIDSTPNGNIINKAVDVEIPERYYNCEPTCEHCNRKRHRKSVYIVQNIETGEFKMVGKSCLKDFTNGMDAEAVASYTSMFEELIQGETPMDGCYIEKRYNTQEYLRYIAETIRHFGYVKTAKVGQSTKDKAADYFGYYHGWFNSVFDKAIREKIEKEIKEYGINADRPENFEEVKEALEWLDSQNEDNNYIHNLKVACSLDYISYKHFGIVASLFPTFNKDLEKQAEIKAQKEVDAKSEHQGKVGDRIEVTVADIRIVTGWSTQFGYTYIYKITDDKGNIYTWKTQKYFNEDKYDSIKTIKGTVKEHNEFRGIKQTELTRCKVL